MTPMFAIPEKLVIGSIGEREFIISDTYKFLDSRFRGNDNYLRRHH